MNRRNRSHEVRSTASTPVPCPAETPETSPTVEEMLGILIRRGVAGDRAAIGRIASIFRSGAVDAAAARLGRYCGERADAEDVFHDVLLAMLEGKLQPPSNGQSALEWLFDLVKSFARAQRKTAARRWGV